MEGRDDINPATRTSILWLHAQDLAAARAETPARVEPAPAPERCAWTDAADTVCREVEDDILHQHIGGRLDTCGLDHPSWTCHPFTLPPAVYRHASGEPCGACEEDTDGEQVCEGATLDPQYPGGPDEPSCGTCGHVVEVAT
jgi:hypothetical protein